MKINIKKLRESAIVPSYGTDFAAGADLYANIEQPIETRHGQTHMIPTGIAIEIPEGYVGLICARSGISCKHGLAPANKIGVIDSDYRGEIIVALHNHNQLEPYSGVDIGNSTITPNERIAQLMIVPYIHADFDVVEELSDSVRNTGGFGSTGTH